jgi:hypothetical protein
MALILCHNGIVTKRMHATISTAPANFQYAPNPDLNKIVRFVKIMHVKYYMKGSTNLTFFR